MFRYNKKISEVVDVSLKKGVYLGVFYVLYCLSAALLVGLRGVDVLRFNSNLMRNMYGCIAVYFSIIFVLCVLCVLLGVFFHKEDLCLLSKVDEVADVHQKDALKKHVSDYHRYQDMANILLSFSILCAVVSFIIITMQVITFPDAIMSSKLLEVYVVAAAVLLAVTAVFVGEFLYFQSEKELVDIACELKGCVAVDDESTLSF